MKKFVLIALASICISYGYQNNTDNKNANFIDVSYENLEVNSESVQNITNINNDNIDFDIALQNPGDFYEFTFDLVNNSRKDYFIAKINKGLTEEHQKYIDYDISYNDGTLLKEQDIIKGHSKEKIKVRISYNPQELPKTAETIPLDFDLILSE